jgi:F-type H+-transporting ATPase subunit beta
MDKDDSVLVLGEEELSREDRSTVSKARRLERFLTQPFFTTEHFTGHPGKLVELEQTITGCERILAGELEDMDEQELYMKGALDE